MQNVQVRFIMKKHKQTSAAKFGIIFNIKTFWLCCIIQQVFFSIFLTHASPITTSDNGDAQPPFLYFQQGDGNQKLTLEPALDEYTIQVGESWKIRCTGSFPLKWSYPNCNSNQKSKTDDRTKIIEHIPTVSDDESVEQSGHMSYDSDRIEFPGQSSQKGSAIKYTSYLEITGIEFSDAGYYTCQYQQSYPSCDYQLHDKPDVAQTYLYASGDPKHLFAWPGGHTIHLYASVEGIIPCRLADPDADVKFNLNGRDITHSLAPKGLEFDPKRGIIVKSPNPMDHSGFLFCQASLNGTTHQTIHIGLQVLDTPPIEHLTTGRNSSNPAHINTDYIHILFYQII